MQISRVYLITLHSTHVPPAGKAFLISDLNGDHLLQRDEFHALATALAVSSSNAVPWLFRLQSRLL